MASSTGKTSLFMIRVLSLVLMSMTLLLLPTSRWEGRATSQETRVQTQPQVTPHQAALDALCNMSQRLEALRSEQEKIRQMNLMRMRAGYLSRGPWLPSISQQILRSAGESKGTFAQWSAWGVESSSNREADSPSTVLPFSWTVEPLSHFSILKQITYGTKLHAPIGQKTWGHFSHGK